MGEKRSGTTTSGRDELRTVLEFLRKGDVLMVTRIDRLARSIGDLQDIVRTIKARGASLKATEQPIDTSTAAGKCFLDMLGVFAEFETNLCRERQLEGIARAKAEGVYKGRPASIDAAKVRAMKAEGIGATEIAKALKIGRASVYARRRIDPSPSAGPLLDHLVGEQQNRWWYLKAEGLGGFGIQGHLKFDRQLNRKLRRLCTAQDAIDIGGCTIKHICVVGTI